MSMIRSHFQVKSHYIGRSIGQPRRASTCGPNSARPARSRRRSTWSVTSGASSCCGRSSPAATATASSPTFRKKSRPTSSRIGSSGWSDTVSSPEHLTRAILCAISTASRQKGADLLPVLQGLAAWAARHIPERWASPRWFDEGKPEHFYPADTGAPHDRGRAATRNSDAAPAWRGGALL